MPPRVGVLRRPESHPKARWCYVVSYPTLGGRRRGGDREHEDGYGLRLEANARIACALVNAAQPARSPAHKEHYDQLGTG